MIREAKEFRAAARESLSGNWGSAVIVTLVYMIISGASSGVPTPRPDDPSGIYLSLFLSSVSYLWLLVLLPVAWGFSVMFLDNARAGETLGVGRMFVGFKDYTRVLGTCLLVVVYTILWTCLLIIPGIIKSYSYSMTYFILRDNPELKFNSAIERSMAMMRGHKFDLFYLQLTFIGWGLLCLLTLGIGFLWLIPYMQSAQAHFYMDVKAEYDASHGAAPSGEAVGAQSAKQPAQDSEPASDANADH